MLGYRCRLLGIIADLMTGGAGLVRVVGDLVFAGGDAASVVGRVILLREFRVGVRARALSTGKRSGWIRKFD